MSRNEKFCGFGRENSDRIVARPRTSSDIVFCHLQTVQEGEESVAGFIATRRSIRRGWLVERDRDAIDGGTEFEHLDWGHGVLKGS
jgi:hypothetical protein